jgi:hypothetical protein
LVDGAIEALFVRFGWLGKATHLSHELQRRRLNLLIGRAGLEIMQDLNVSTHKIVATTTETDRQMDYN